MSRLSLLAKVTQALSAEGLVQQLGDHKIHVAYDSQKRNLRLTYDGPVGKSAVSVSVNDKADKTDKADKKPPVCNPDALYEVISRLNGTQE